MVQTLKLYQNLSSLEQVKQEYNHHCRLMDIKPFYKPNLRVGFIDGLGYMLFSSFPDSLITKLGFEIVDVNNC